MSEPEHEIRERFAAWRAEVERSVPPFSETVSSALRREESPARVWRVRAAIVAIVCSIAAAGIVVRQNVARHEKMPLASASAPQPSLVTWSSPTAFLLETPGRELLRETPRFEPVLYLDRRLP
jgi:hypothetical protein